MDPAKSDQTMMAEPLRVLLVEDSNADAELILHEIINAAFTPTYEIVDNPAAMRRALEARSWDIIISDYCSAGRPRWRSTRRDGSTFRLFPSPARSARSSR